MVIRKSSLFKTIMSIPMETFLYPYITSGDIILFLKVTSVTILWIVFPFRDPILGLNISPAAITSDIITGQFGS